MIDVLTRTKQHFTNWHVFHIVSPLTCEALVGKAATSAFSHGSPGGTWRVALGWGVNTTGDVYIEIHSLFTKEPRSSLPGAWPPVLSGRARGSGGGARPCCCWSRVCSVCCRCCGPRCCSPRPAGRWGPAAFPQSPLCGSRCTTGPPLGVLQSQMLQTQCPSRLWCPDHGKLVEKLDSVP